MSPNKNPVRFRATSHEPRATSHEPWITESTINNIISSATDPVLPLKNRISDPSINMFKHVPWASHEEGSAAEGKKLSEEEKSLTSILDANQRSELTLLIASATASMRETVESNFDASVRLLPVPRNKAAWNLL